MHLVVKDLKTGKSVQVEEKGAVIGRGAGADIVADDPKAAEQHTRIRFEAGRWLIEDSKTELGVVVHGAKLIAPKELRTGMRFLIGTQTFEVYIPAAKPVTSPVASPVATKPVAPAAGAPVTAAASGAAPAANAIVTGSHPAHPSAPTASPVSTPAPTANQVQTPAQPKPAPSPQAPAAKPAAAMDSDATKIERIRDITEMTQDLHDEVEPVTSAPASGSELLKALDEAPAARPPLEETAKIVLSKQAASPAPSAVNDSSLPRIPDPAPATPSPLLSREIAIGIGSGVFVLGMLIYALATTNLVPPVPPAITGKPAPPPPEPASAPVQPPPRPPEPEQTPYQRYASRRADIERLIDANPVLLKQNEEVLALYDRLHGEMARPEPKKPAKKKRSKATEDRLRELDLFERTQALVDALYDKLNK